MAVNCAKPTPCDRNYCKGCMWHVPDGMKQCCDTCRFLYKEKFGMVCKLDYTIVKAGWTCENWKSRG